MMSKYPTLQAIGMRWIVSFEMFGTCLFVALVLLGFSLPLVGRPYDPTYAFIGVVFMFVMGLMHYLVFYELVKCPSCSGKLNKFKNGNNVPIKQAHIQLNNGYGCRRCGWKPNLQGCT